MNKYYIDAVIVVEGKSDVSYLSSFIDSQFFITNGYDISNEKLEFLTEVAKVNKIIVLTDNDKAGKEIENKIKSRIQSVICVKTPLSNRKNYSKSGVAETNKEVILDAMKPYICSENQKGQNRKYNLTSIISLSDNPAEIKDKIIKEYRLIDGNNSFLEKQLNMLRVDEQEFRLKYGN